MVGVFVITPWSLPRFLSYHKRFALRYLLHLQTDFQAIPSSGLLCRHSQKSNFKFSKIVHNSIALHPISIKIGLKVCLNMLFLLLSKIEENWLQHARVIAIFLKCAKRKRRLRRKIRRNQDKLWRRVSPWWLSGSAEIWNGMCPTPRNLPQKKLCSSVETLSSYRCVKTASTWFLYNTIFSVANPYWLYLATPPTIVCLGIGVYIFPNKVMSIFSYTMNVSKYSSTFISDHLHKKTIFVTLLVEWWCTDIATL